MEALRPQEPSHQQHNGNIVSLDEELPPPPEPFPEYRSAQNGHTTAPQVLQQDYATLQSTCVAVLHSLLPSDAGDRRSAFLAEGDQPLAAALTELLETTYELESFGPSPAYEEVAGPSTPPAVTERSGAEGSFAALAEHLGGLQSGLEAPRAAHSRESLQPAIDVYRQQVTVERIQTLSRVVLGMVRARESGPSETERNGTLDVPTVQQRTEARTPEYELNEKHLDDLPDYEEISQANGISDKKSEAGPSSPRQAPPSEKMLHDFEHLTSAIERLGALSTGYADQRSVLRPVRPRSSSPVLRAANGTKGKGREERQMSDKAKMKELEDIWRKIERAHGKRRMRDDQRVDMEGVRGRRAEERSQFLQELYERAEMSRMKGQDGEMGTVNGDLARARELRDRDQFLRELLETSAGARLEDQDASAPTEDAVRHRQHEARQAYLQDMVDRMRSGRLETQDYPQTPEDRIALRRQSLVDSLVNFSSSGRMADQDSRPPTPRHRSFQGQDPHELVTMENFFKDGPQIPDARDGRGRSSSGTVEAEKKTGTLRGMMRRRSQALGLGLKSAKETDFSQVNYIAEHQENLNIVTVTFFGPQLPLSSDLQLKSFDPASCSRPAVEAILEIGNSSLRIPLPVPIQSHQSVPLIAHGLHLEAKLSSVPMATFAPSLISSVSHPLSASELRKLNPRGLCCTTCDREIASISAKGLGGKEDERFKDLPSEHWAEMMEVWMCHDDPGFTARLAKQTKEGFWPAKGRVLVGGSYVLVNAADVKRANITSKSTKDTSWDVQRCLCGEILGKARKMDNQPGAGTVRFSKWALALLRDDDVDGENVEPTRYPLETYITSDMLDLAQAHATYRLMIIDEETDKQKILIWLFNPSLRISYRRSSPSIAAPPSPLRTSRSAKSSRRSSVASASSRSSPTVPESSTGHSRSLRACKIMYRQVSSGDGAQGQGQVEELRYPSEVVNRLLGALEASTLVYPEERRKMGSWDVGFLARM